MLDPRMDRFTVEPEEAGTRLDHWLVQHFPERSRSELQRWIRNGLVDIAGSSVKASLRLETEQTISVTAPLPAAKPSIEAEPIPLDIVFEDQDLVVVNKSPGMVVHPAPGHSKGTLVNAVLHHCPDIQGIGGELRPGIVHRLDKDTSGLIVVAKNDAALRELQRQFKERTVEKHYLALLEGRIAPERGRISVPLGRHPTDRKRQAAFSSTETRTAAHVREAITEYETLGLYATPSGYASGPAQFTFISTVLLTGRTHQLRVHFAWMKHPIVGDTVYGYRKQRLAIKRLFLHSHTLKLMLPSTGEVVSFQAPLPDALSDLLDMLSPA